MKERMTLLQAYTKNPGIGRRKLMKLTGCTGYACEMFLNGNYKDGYAAKSSAGLPPLVDLRPLAVTLTESAVCGAISLHKARVLASRPQGDNVKRQLYGLRKGQGYPLTSLAETWGMSEDTLRKHAKRLDCLRYVETGPGDWAHCVLHPDTAKDYKKGTR